jgi:hypothetical protein
MLYLSTIMSLFVATKKLNFYVFLSSLGRARRTKRINQVGKRKVDQRDPVQDLIPDPDEKSAVPDPGHDHIEERGRAAPVIRREGMTDRHHGGGQSHGRRKDDNRIEDRSRALKERRRKRRKRNCSTETFILNRSWPAPKEMAQKSLNFLGIVRYRYPDTNVRCSVPEIQPLLYNMEPV